MEIAEKRLDELRKAVKKGEKFYADKIAKKTTKFDKDLIIAERDRKGGTLGRMKTQETAAQKREKTLTEVVEENRQAVKCAKDLLWQFEDGGVVDSLLSMSQADSQTQIILEILAKKSRALFPRRQSQLGYNARKGTTPRDRFGDFTLCFNSGKILRVDIDPDELFSIYTEHELRRQEQESARRMAYYNHSMYGGGVNNRNGTSGSSSGSNYNIFGSIWGSSSSSSISNGIRANIANG